LLVTALFPFFFSHAEPAAAAAEEEEPASSKSEMMAALKAKGSSKLRKSAAVDSHVPGSGRYTVYSSATETFDCMLNQTNIGQNNNKYACHFELYSPPFR
jgi:hypothetical protein